MSKLNPKDIENKENHKDLAEVKYGTKNKDNQQSQNLVL